MTFKYSKNKELYLLKHVSDIVTPEVFGVYKKAVTSGTEPSAVIRSRVSKIEQEWLLVEQDFYRALGKFYNINISRPKVTCYLVRFAKFIYYYRTDNPWFSAPLFGSSEERHRVIMHELCHFFQPDKLPRSIKEAIPVILNDSATFNMYSPDHGHKDVDEQYWRKIIWNIYKNGGDYNDLMKIYNKN